MSGAKIHIRSISRFEPGGEEERLEFAPGVNLVIGPPNTGKSKWMSTIDLLFGDPSAPEAALGADLAEKYTTASMILSVNDQLVTIERRWGVGDVSSRVRVGQTWMPASAVTEHLLTVFELPAVRYPRGDPFAERRWPLLGWRQLLRHIYRRESSWSELASQQPEVDQHACVVFFLGLADRVFPEAFGTMVALRKRLAMMVARHDQFEAVLQEVARGLLHMDFEPTLNAVRTTLERWRRELEEMDATRQPIVDQALAGENESVLRDLNESWRSIQRDIAETQTDIASAQARRRELADYANDLQSESRRLQRAGAAARRLADLRVTHCPACDREIDVTVSESRRCSLCKRPLEEPVFDEDAAARVAFEQSQLAEELGELKTLIAALDEESLAASERLQALEDHASSRRLQIRSLASSSSAAVSTVLGKLDQDIGAKRQQISQLARIERAVLRQSELAAEIETLQQEVDALNERLADLTARQPELDARGAVLAASMNEYLHRIALGDRSRWPHEDVVLDLRPRGFEFQVRGRNWRTALGGTLFEYALMSYQYGLASLSDAAECSFPGLTMIDLPPEFLRDVEGVNEQSISYLIQPFIEAFGSGRNCQVIIAGHSLETVEGANVISLSRVWV